MNKIISLSAVFLLCAFTVYAAVTPGGLPKLSDGKTTANNLSEIAPAKAKSRCDTVSSTSAVQKNYSTAGYVNIKATATNINTGAPIVVKWKENGVQAWVGSEYKAVNSHGSTFSTLNASTFDNRSAAFCVQRQ